MCGRYVSRAEAAIERDAALRRAPVRFESYNVAPGQKVPVIPSMHGAPVCELLRWGLVPFWAKGVTPRFSTINARPV